MPSDDGVFLFVCLDRIEDLFVGDTLIDPSGRRCPESPHEIHVIE